MPVNFSKAVSSDTHFGRNLDMPNFHQHTATCVVDPINQQVRQIE